MGALQGQSVCWLTIPLHLAHDEASSFLVDIVHLRVQAPPEALRQSSPKLRAEPVDVVLPVIPLLGRRRVLEQEQVLHDELHEALHLVQKLAAQVLHLLDQMLKVDRQVRALQQQRAQGRRLLAGPGVEVGAVKVSCVAHRALRVASRAHYSLSARGLEPSA